MEDRNPPHFQSDHFDAIASQAKICASQKSNSALSYYIYSKDKNNLHQQVETTTE